MTDDTKFTFRIDGLSPDDLPMRRLAAYLEEFSRLLGEEASTQFDGVYPGSTRLTARALYVAVPKVRTRLAAARDGVQDDAHRLISRLDDMLAEDNASGTLSEDGQSAVIIRFLGANARSAHLPAVTESGSLQGELVRIGGRDNTAHATLRDGDRFYTCVVTKEVARALGKYLFGPPLRLHGRGRWRRTPDGTWELAADFRASEFEVLDPASLQAAAGKLREVGGFGVAADALDVLRTLRGD